MKRKQFVHYFWFVVEKFDTSNYEITRVIF